MYCWNCGGQISRDMQYCELCGAELEKTQSYSQSEFNKELHEEAKKEKELPIEYKRMSKNRVNLEYEKKAEHTIKEKRKNINHAIIHERKIKKPSHDFFLLVCASVSMIYLIILLLNHSDILEDGLTNNMLLSHIFGMLAANVILGCGMYVRQEGLFLASALMFMMASLFYIPGLWIGWICGALCFWEYHMRWVKNRKILKKKRVDSRIK